MGSSRSKPLLRPPVPAGKKRLCIVGSSYFSHRAGRARSIADEIAKAHPHDCETWFYFDSKGFKPFLRKMKTELPSYYAHFFENDGASPFCWLEYANGRKVAIGHLQDLMDWVHITFKADSEVNGRIFDLCTKRLTIISKELFPKSTPGTADTLSYYLSNSRYKY